MYGRFTIYTPFRRLGQQLELDLDLPPRYNIAPSLHIPIIRLNPSGRDEVADAHRG
ncbi:MAG TPA: hypothetical protein VJ575_00745 [Pseudogulbenkiania sp.]|nr:hypothetical protein [Pseudogulbenkiania sp.]